MPTPHYEYECYFFVYKANTDLIILQAEMRQKQPNDEKQ